MSENVKFFKLQKCVPGEVVFFLSPASNPQVKREVRLTDRNPFQMLAKDWAYGVFMDNGVYSLYSRGFITFEDNDELVKLAYEDSIYYSESLDFEPATVNNTDEIKAILKSGNRKQIEDAVKKYSADRVKIVAIDCRDELSMAVVNTLENMLKIQLIIDGGEDTAE